jgi:hypothetical protein
MKPYWIKIVVDGVRHEYQCIAACWYDAWNIAVDEWGMPQLICVKPV